jgi:hypothetical protein
VKSAFPATTDSAEAHAMERGRTKTRNVAWVLVIISLSVIGTYVQHRGLDRIGTQLVRLVLTIGLAWLVAQGRGWARILTVVLAGLGAIGMTFVAVSAPNGWGAFTGACYALSYALVVMRLNYDHDVRAYFAAVESGEPSA